MIPGTFKQGLLVGVAPALFVASLLLGLQFPSESVSGPLGEEVSYRGWPMTCCTTIQENHGAQLTIREFDRGGLAFNVVWCLAISICAWIVTAFVWHSKSGPWHEQQ
jgi:hypothetical protein